MKKKRKWNELYKPYLWLLPSMVVFGVFTFYPFLQTIYKSLFIVDSIGRVRDFVGLENYIYVLKDQNFLLAVRNTLIYTLLTVPISKVIGFLLALLANKRRALSSFYETSFALPMAMASSVVAMIFQLLYVYPLGILHGRLGLDVHWLTDPKTALIAVGIVQIWLSSGYAFIFMLSAVRNVPADLLESADLDGASPVRKMVSIYLPLTTPTLFYLVVTDLIFGMLAMGLMNVMTAGGPNGSTMTIMLYIYQLFARMGNYTTANAATILAFLMTLVCTLLTFIWEKKGVHYQ